jgi:hypothetical protein
VNLISNKKNVTTIIVSLCNQIRIYFLFSQAKIDYRINNIKAQLIATMKKIILDPEEQDLLEAFEAGGLNSIMTPVRKHLIEVTANQSYQHNKRINIKNRLCMPQDLT